MELFLVLVCFVAGYLIGRFTMYARFVKGILELKPTLSKELNQALDNMLNVKTKQEPVNTAPKLDIRKLQIENIKDVFYLYTNDSNKDFICQANTLDELANLAFQYKKIKYAVVAYKEEIITFVEGKITDRQTIQNIIKNNAS